MPCGCNQPKRPIRTVPAAIKRPSPGVARPRPVNVRR